VDGGVARPGHLRATVRQLEGELAEPVLPRDQRQHDRTEPEDVSVGRPRRRDRRRLGADATRRSVRRERAGERNRGGQEQPPGDPLVQRQREDEEADVLVEEGIGHPEVGPVQPQRDELPVRAHDGASDEEPGRCGDRELRGQHDPAQEASGRARVRVSRALGRGALGDPGVSEQDARRGEPDEAAHQPPAREQRPEHALLAELVEPHPLRLEMGRDACQQRCDRQHGEHQRSAQARSAPPT
jgi:hypothetical protein